MLQTKTRCCLSGGEQGKTILAVTVMDGAASCRGLIDTAHFRVESLHLKGAVRAPFYKGCARCCRMQVAELSASRQMALLSVFVFFLSESGLLKLHSRHLSAASLHGEVPRRLGYRFQDFLECLKLPCMSHIYIWRRIRTNNWCADLPLGWRFLCLCIGDMLECVVVESSLNSN